MKERQYKHLDTITGLFIAILLIANIVSSKIIGVGPLAFAGGIVIFPLSYIFGDILTEVYGYRRARKVIWLGVLSNILLATIIIIVGNLPPATGWPNQDAYEKILGMTPRIIAASVIAYFAGEFSNSFVLAKLKLKTKGKMLWFRTIGSTVVGELVDTALFISIAFWGILPQSLLVTIIVSNYLAKTAIEVLFTPVTYSLVNWLKKEEEEDYFDKKTNFSPFAM